MQNLVIVESPTKARTLSKFLGSKYRIEASMGHLRDLPKSKLGVDVDHNFEPQYIIPKDKQKRVTELKKLSEGVKDIWLATDPDREGEAISWHIANILNDNKGKTKGTLHRVTFHEITPDAIKEAFKNPREIDSKLVDAQQARRVLDRIVGYKLSPVLWKKVKSGLSAGRVQTVALRLVVEREKEIEAFKAVEYWSIEADLDAAEARFRAQVIELSGQKLVINNKTEADGHLKALQSSTYQVNKVTKKEVRRYPVPPFTTSTLQQTAGNKLRFTAKKTMSLAQNLYEHGLITYMRTDSVNIAAVALTASREYIAKNYGQDYLPKVARTFKASSKNSQEAHEAIRPTEVDKVADKIKFEGLTRDHVRLYDLIWKRLIASQVNEAIFDQTSVDVEAIGRDPEQAQGAEGFYTLRAVGTVLKFDGWLRVYGIKELSEEESEDPSKNQSLPKNLAEGQTLKLIELLPEQHFTQPPPRYTESSLIKKLEDLGIGRPSTYAPTLSTIQDRFYVEKIDKKFKPSALGRVVSDFLIEHFPAVFDYEFTAQMEDQLDQIALGERPWKETLSEFYGPFQKTVEATEDTAEKVKLEVEVTDKVCSECGKFLVVRQGKFGKFLACSGFPDCKHTESIEEILATKCPKDGGDVVARRTKKGRTFYGCKNYPKCDFASWTKPK